MSDKKFTVIMIVVGLVLVAGFIVFVEVLNNKYVITNPLYEGACDLEVVDCSPEGKDVSFGDASFYDYTLASGWSSVGHDVCAARDWPRWTTLRATFNGRSVECLVTDYGPDESVHPDRIIDLSSSAFSKLASLKVGVISVSVQEIK